MIALEDEISILKSRLTALLSLDQRIKASYNKLEYMKNVSPKYDEQIKITQTELKGYFHEFSTGLKFLKNFIDTRPDSIVVLKMMSDKYDSMLELL